MASDAAAGRDRDLRRYGVGAGVAQRDRARVTRIKRMNRNAARQRDESERGAERAQQRLMRLRPAVERLVDGGEGRRRARIVLARKDIFQHVETDRPGAEQERRRVGEGFFQGDHRKEQHDADQRVDGERPAREHARREDLIRLRRMQPIDEALRCADRACVKLHKPHGQCAEHEREHGVREIVCGERNAAEQHRERGRGAERAEQRPVPVSPGLDGFPECGAGSS